jgi:hypothetical protein
VLLYYTAAQTPEQRNVTPNPTTSHPSRSEVRTCEVLGEGLLLDAAALEPSVPFTAAAAATRVAPLPLPGEN